ncbi:hypothetical protein Tco_1410827 [Tanacetum coccineum]
MDRQDEIAASDPSSVHPDDTLAGGSVRKNSGYVKSIPLGHGGHENKLKGKVKVREASKEQVAKKTVDPKPNPKTHVKQKSKDVVKTNAPVKPKPVKPSDQPELL